VTDGFAGHLRAQTVVPSSPASKQAATGMTKVRLRVVPDAAATPVCAAPGGRLGANAGQNY